jgi:hypothetical protein
VESFDPAHLVKEVHGIAISGTIVYETNSEGNEVAVFTEGPAEFGLIVTKTGTGAGEVECELNKSGTFGPCATEYPEGTEVTLKGTADAGSTFEGWSGTGSAAPCTGTSNCTFVLKEDSTVNATFTSELATFPLSVFKVGEGKVTSSPSGITCEPTCSAEFAEGAKVTLTESPETGYEFAVWIGCKHVTITTCEVTIGGEAEVTAVFLKAGKEGQEGKTGPEGKQGPSGGAGATGPQGPAGAAGAAGEKGANGSQGPAGGQGSTGPVGPAGGQGPTGPAGQVQLVTCRTVKKGKKSVQKCTTKLVSGTVKFTTTSASARATLSRHGEVFAAGMARVVAHGRLSLRLTPLCKLQAGRYELTLISGAGAHEAIRTELFTLD